MEEPNLYFFSLACDSHRLSDVSLSSWQNSWCIILLNSISVVFLPCAFITSWLDYFVSISWLSESWRELGGMYISGSWIFSASGPLSTADASSPDDNILGFGDHKRLVLMSSPNKTLVQNVLLFRISLILTHGQLHCFLSVNTRSSPGSRVNLHTCHPEVFVFLPQTCLWSLLMDLRTAG